MSKGITSDLDLLKLCNKYNLNIICIDYKDKLPKKAIDGCYIVNLASSNAQGTHWCALFLKNKEAFYFDSFGFNAPLEVLDFVKGFTKKNLTFSEKQIQSLRSNYCGQYCIDFLRNMSYGGKKGSSLSQRYINFLNEYKDD